MLTRRSSTLTLQARERGSSCSVKRSTRLSVLVSARYAGGRGGGARTRGAPESEDVFKNLKLTSPPETLDSSDRAASRGPGRAGTTIEVLTNLYKLSIPIPVLAHQYDVEMQMMPRAEQSGARAATPKPVQRKRAGMVGREEAAAVIKELAASQGWTSQYVYDNAASMFSIRDDLAAEDSFSVRLGDGAMQQEFKVKLRKVGILDTKQAVLNYVKGTGSPATQAALAPALNLLEMVSKAAPAADSDSVRTPSGYLSYKGAGRAQQYGRQLLKVLSGFRSSIRVLKAGVLISVDHQVGVVLEDGPLMDMLVKVAGLREVSNLIELKQKAKAAKVDISGYQVQLSHISSRPRLQSISPLSAKDLKFKLKDENDREVSVLQYYKERYGLTLKYPDLPCVLAKNGAAFPMELCTVVKSQRRTQLKDVKDQANLIRAQSKEAVVRPEERLLRVRAAMKTSLSSIGGQVAQAFGLQLGDSKPLEDPKLLKVPARRIPGPTLEYKGGQQLSTGGEGAWRPPAASKAAGRWTSGAMLMLLGGSGPEKAGLEALRFSLDSKLKYEGCPLPSAAPTRWATSCVTVPDIEELMRNTVNAAKAACGGKVPELLLVVLPERAGDDVRNEVKRVGHTVLGVATQCCDPVKAGVTRQEDSRKLDQYCGNLALKINNKLGGTTAELAGEPKKWAPVFGDKHFMVMGADVSRSIQAGRGATATTYAAVVGTQDRQAVRMKQQMLVQIGKNDDLIYGMHDASRVLIEGYAHSNGGNLPEVILMYRDGVSESFYDAVLVTEFQEIKRACRSIRPDYEPKIVFVVVSKSHNIRFFPAPGDTANTNKSGNVKPGTIIDDKVVDMFAFEFFLNSHAGILGTNRVPKYTVLVDEYGLSSDSMQILTHWLCHLYGLCHRSVSVPPVVMYADKAAEMARPLGGDAAARLAASGGNKATSLQPHQEYELLSPLAMSDAQSMSFI